MKRITKKILLIASAFSSVMNMNGCGAYGPPPDEEMKQPKDTQVVLEAEDAEETAETKPVSDPKLMLFQETQNMNPCVYGPPPGAGGMKPSTDSPRYRLGSDGPKG